MSKIQKESERKVYQDAATLRLTGKEAVRQNPTENIYLMDGIRGKTLAGVTPTLLPRRHVLGKPAQRPHQHVRAMLRIHEPVPFVGIDNQLCRHMLIA